MMYRRTLLLFVALWVVSVAGGVLGAHLEQGAEGGPRHMVGATKPIAFVPTGTGFMHVSGGAQDVASQAPSMVGTCASRPSATGGGSTYRCSDYPFVYTDTGSWQQFISDFLPAPPAVGSFTTYGHMLLAQQGDFLLAAVTSNDNTVSSGALASATFPTAPWYVRMEANFATPFIQPGSGFPELGLCVSVGATIGTSHAYCTGPYLSGGGFGYHNTEFVIDGARVNLVCESSSQTSIVSANRLFHLRILNDGSAFHNQISADGIQWVDWCAQATVAADHYGFVLYSGAASGNAVGEASLYSLTAPAAAVGQTITGATGNGVPVQVVVASTASFLAGDIVAVHGMTGNTAANCGAATATQPGVTGGGTSTILVTSVDDATHMTLNATGNGAYISGGTVTLVSR